MCKQEYFLVRLEWCYYKWDEEFFYVGNRIQQSTFLNRISFIKAKKQTKQCKTKEKNFNYPVIKIKMFSVTIQNYISLSLKTLPKVESFQWLQRATKA